MTTETIIQTASTCALCDKPVCVGLYLRVKPWPGRSKSGRVVELLPRSTHKFYGYWPPESHMLDYLREEAQKHSLQRWYNENCRGHSLDEIVEAIEQTQPPLPGIPIRVMWNPATKVAQYMRAESPSERRQAQMDLQSDVRATVIHQRGDVRQAIVFMLNNTIETQPLVSLPGGPVKRYEGPLTGVELPTEPEAKAAYGKAQRENAGLLRRIGSLINERNKGGLDNG